MIVYGDPQSIEPFDALVERLRSLLQRALTSFPPSTDDLRALLARAGQLEQAVYDAQSMEQDALASIHAVTLRLANGFYSAWIGASSGELREALPLALQALEQVQPTDQLLTVKLPEGFAFYMLYPEQYLLTARRWLHDHAASEERTVLVVGIRSIGTTLAAVVTSAIQSDDSWTVSTFTVRPGGHPFERTVELPVTEINPNSWGIIVDEGPGLSGSSFAAAAEALVRAGIRRERISFFPGHEGEPGNAASDRVREWWDTTPRYFTPLSETRFDGQLLQQALAAESARLLGSEVVNVEDFGGGLWRFAVYPPEQIPSSCIPFERPKYRVTLASGEQALWKFSGFAAAPASDLTTAERDLGQMQARYDADNSPQPLGHLHGFVAQKWINGERLTRSDITPKLVEHFGGYIVRAAGAPLASSEQEAALARLREMLYWNTWELLGEAQAEKTRRWTNINAPPQRYGDGRPAPHEWLRTPDGSILKTDSAAHDLDPVAVGTQSLLWDVAGVWVQWGLSEERAEPMLKIVCQHTGEPISSETLAFYRAAYAAFRGGMCMMCAQSADEAEQKRLYRAADFYKRALTREIES